MVPGGRGGTHRSESSNIRANVYSIKHANAIEILVQQASMPCY